MNDSRISASVSSLIIAYGAYKIGYSAALFPALDKCMSNITEFIQQRLVNCYDDIAQHAMNDRYILYQISKSPYSIKPSFVKYWIKTNKNLNTLILREENNTEVISDAKMFTANKNLYKAKGLIYKRVYYLYGMSGTGKTNIPKVLSVQHKYPIYVVPFRTFSQFGNSGKDAVEAVIDLPYKDAIVLIDEFNLSEDENLSGYTSLLTYLDGIRELNNVMVFICTNNLTQHLESKYNALFRPGRINVMSEFKECSIDQCRKLLRLYYEPSELIDQLTTIRSISPSYLTDLATLPLEDVIKKITLAN